MSEVIVITSGKGGVGKTTTTANIGIGLAKLGKKVLVIDTDLGLRNLDVVLGLENRIVYNLVDVIEGKCRPKQAIIKDKRFQDLYLLPSAQTKDKSSVSPEQMKKLTEDLREDYDFVLLDCPAGIEQGFQNAIAGADKAIVVTTPEVSSIRDADRIIGLLEGSGLRDNQLVINRLRVDMVKKGDMMSVEDVTEILAIDLLGVIPDDESVVIATNQGEPVVGEASPAGKGYENICRRLRGDSGDRFFTTWRNQKKTFGFISSQVGGKSYECTFCCHCKRQTEKSADVRQDSMYTRYDGKAFKGSISGNCQVYGA